MFNFVAYADTVGQPQQGASFLSFLPLILLIVIMYFLMIRPQKKKDKEVQQMRSNLQVGDEIVTIGGIRGKIVKTKEETIVIQVGADKVKFELEKWAVSTVLQKSASRQEKKEEKEEVLPVEKKKLPKKLKKGEEEKPETVEEPKVEVVEEPKAEVTEE